MMAATIDAKVEKLDLIDLNTLCVSPFVIMIYLFVLSISITRELIGKYQLLGTAGQQNISGHTVPLPYIMSNLYLISATTGSLRVTCSQLNQPLEDTGNTVGHNIVKILDKFEISDKVCTFMLLFFNTMTDMAWLAACPGW